MQFPNPNLDPHFEGFGNAMATAARLAHEQQVAHTIVAECSDHKLGFHSFASETYASLRERGLTHSMAPVASVLPSGSVELYSPFKEMELCARNAAMTAGASRTSG